MQQVGTIQVPYGLPPGAIVYPFSPKVDHDDEEDTKSKEETGQARVRAYYGKNRIDLEEIDKQLADLESKIDWGSVEWQKATLNQVTIIAPYPKWYGAELSRFLQCSESERCTHPPLRMLSNIPRGYIVSIENCATHKDANAYFYIQSVSQEPVITIAPGKTEKVDLYAKPLLFTSMDIKMDIPIVSVPVKRARFEAIKYLIETSIPTSTWIWSDIAWKFILETGAICEDATLPENAAEYDRLSRAECHTLSVSSFDEHSGDVDIDAWLNQHPRLQMWFKCPPVVSAAFSADGEEHTRYQNALPAFTFTSMREERYFETAVNHAIDCPDGRTGCDVAHYKVSYSVNADQRSRRNQFNAAPRISFAQAQAKWRDYLLSIVKSDVLDQVNKAYPLDSKSSTSSSPLVPFPLLEETNCCKVTTHDLLPEKLEEKLSADLANPSIGWRGYADAGGFLAKIDVGCLIGTNAEYIKVN